MFQKLAAAALGLTLATSAQAQHAISVASAFQLAFHGNGVRQTDQGEIAYVPKRLVRTGNVLVLLSEGTNTCRAHACSGALSIHYLEARPDGWRLTGEWLTLAGGGGWGDPPSWNVSRSLLSSPVLYTERGGTWQGCSSMLAQLVPLLPSGAGKPIDIPIFYDDGDTLHPQLAGEGTITDVRKDAGFSVHFSGQRKGKSWASVDRYAWDGSGFDLVGRRSLETC